MTRKHPWAFTGQRDANGEPAEWHAGIPARDLAEADVAALSDEEYAVVEASRLYRQAAPAKAAPVKPVSGAEE
jgi:hypothetical protein